MKTLAWRRIAYMLAVGVSLAEGADWPQWRGPGRDGVSTEKGWFKEGAAARVVWEASVGAGYSAVAIRGGRLYTAGNRENRDVLVCLDAATGKQVWQYDYACPAGSYPGPRSTPATDESSVYFVSRQAQVFCLEAATGVCRWQRDLKADLGVALPTWGIAGSPVLEGNLLLVNLGERGVCLDKQTGATRWDSGGSGTGYASPVVMGSGTNRSVLVFAAKRVVASDLESGRQLWEYPWVTSYDVNAADPIVVEGKVFITSGYDRGGALLKVQPGAPAVVWENKGMGSHFGTPVVRQGYVYGGHGNTGRGSIRCVELATGAVKWEHAGIMYGSVLLAGDTLLIQGEKGVLAVAAATPEKYRELWQGKVLDGICWTMPTLSDGLVYCRNDKGRLVCLDLKGP